MSAESTVGEHLIDNLDQGSVGMKLVPELSPQPSISGRQRGIGGGVSTRRRGGQNSQ